MEEIRLLASHPDYKQIQELQQLLVWMTNPQMLFGNSEYWDMADLEQEVVKQSILNDIQFFMDGYVSLPISFANFIETDLEQDNSNEGSDYEDFIKRYVRPKGDS